MKSKKIEQLIKKHNNLKKEYQSLLSSQDVESLVEENKELKRTLRNYERELINLEDDIYNLRDRNKRLRLALKEKVIDERMKLLKMSRKKLEIYFSARANDYKDRLTALEDEVKTSLSKLDKKVRTNLADDQEELLADIDKLTTKIDKRIQHRREQFEEERTEIKNYYNEGQDELANRKVEKKDIEKRKEHNNLEEIVGLSWINKAGIAVIVLAVIAISKYAYFNFFNQYLKITFIYFLGGLSLSLGEFCFQKKNKFADCLISGGVLILYFASFNPYFSVGYFNFSWGMISVAIITLLAIYLAIKHHSQIIFSISLIGGYSPLLFYIFYNINKGFSFNIFNFRLMIAYTLIIFIVYTIVIIYFNQKYYSIIKIRNRLFLSLNTLISFSILYWWLSKTYFLSFIGILPLFFSMFYLFLEQKLAKSKYNLIDLREMFQKLGIIFFILISPLQLSLPWWPLGWLAEGLVVIYYLFIRQNLTVARFSKSGRLLNHFKYFAIASSWFYLMYFSMNIETYFLLIWIFLNFGLGYILENVELLNDKIVDYFSIFTYLVADLVAVYVTLNKILLVNKTSFWFYLYFGLLVIINALLLFNLRKLIIIFLKKYEYNLEFYSLSLGMIYLVYSTAVIIVQFNLMVTNLVFTVVYSLLAIAYIYYGLYRKFVYIRLFGLVVMIIALIKLFLYDLSFLEGIEQTLAYLGLGVSLLLISFSYQKLKNKL